MSAPDHPARAPRSTAPDSTGAPRSTAPERLAAVRRPLFWAMVAVIALASQQQAWFSFDGPAETRARIAVLAAVVTAALALCRRVPLLSLVTSAVAIFLLATEDPETVVYAPIFATAAPAYLLGRRDDDRELAIGVTVAGGFLLAAELIDAYPSNAGSLLVILLLSMLGPAGLGRASRDRSRLHARLRARAEADEADRLLVAQHALLDERTKIAGELHDVVAHALSAMIVQAGAARVQIGRDPARAAEAFAAVEGTGRDALFEIRSLLGVLRSAADEHALEPQPSVEGLAQLVARTAAAGLPTELDVRGTPRALTPGTSLAAYRVVQDALRSAREHGAATDARVVVEWDGDLRIRVRDDGAVDRPPLPARERVLLYGGDFSAGRTGPSRSGARGGSDTHRAAEPVHEVRVRLPIRATAAA